MAIDLGRWLKDRKKQVVDVFDANTVADQQRRMQAGQPRMYQQQQAQPQAPQRVQPQQQQRPSQFTNGLGSNPFQVIKPTAPTQIAMPTVAPVAKPQVGAFSDHQKWQINRLNQTTPMVVKDREKIIADSYNAINNPNANAKNAQARSDFYKSADQDRLNRIVGNQPINSRDEGYKRLEEGLTKQGKGQQLADARANVVKHNTELGKSWGMGSDLTANPKFGTQMNSHDALRAIDPQAYDALERSMNANKKTGRSGVNQVLNNFIDGATRTFAKAPTNATNALYSAVDAVAPEGSSIDKFSEKMRNFSQAKTQSINNAYDKAGVGQQAGDNPFLAVPSSGAGQIASGIITGGTNIGIATGVDVMGSTQRDMQMKGVDDETKQLLTSLPNAVVQGLLEKYGMDTLTSSIGKNILKKFLFKAGSEGTQEGLQELTGNIATNTYDKTQGILENVPQAAGWGAVLGGGTSLALGGMESPDNQNQQQTVTSPTLPTPPRPSVARPNEYNVLSDYQDVLHGNIKDTNVINQTISDARQAAQRVGVDITSGSPSDIDTRINEVLSRQAQPQSLQDPVVQNIPVNQMVDPQSMRDRIRAAKERVLTPLNKYGGSNADFDSPTITNDLTGKTIPNPAYKGETDPIKQAQEIAQKTEALKRQGKITPNDEGYWTTTIKGQPKTPVPVSKDVNGVQVKEGDTIEFAAVLDDGKRGRTTVRWEEPYIANASGTKVDGSWLGNGKLPSRLPFEIVKRADGNHATQPPRSTPKTAEAKKPLSTTEKQDIQKELDKFYGEDGDQKFMTSLIEKYQSQLNGKNNVLSLMNPQEKARYDQIVADSTPKPPTPFEQNLQTAGLAPKKSKGLVVSETKPINGQKIQKVRTGPGKVEQRVVQDQSSVIADALGIPQEQRTPTSSFDKQAAQTQRVADNINSKDDNIAYNEQPRDIKQKKSKVQFTETFNRWLGTKQAAKTRSVATARTLKKLNNSDALEAIQAIDNSSYVPKSDKAKQFVEQFRTKTDVLYQRYTGEKGVNIGYVEDYLPRIYKNPEGGEPLTKAEYQALQMSTGRMKGREADQIDVDALITKDPRELLAKYVDSMENVVNNRSFVDSLKKSGHLIESPSRPQGTVIIDAPGFPQPRVFTNPDTGEKIQGNYYATPDVAKVLNRSFEPDIRTSTTGKVLKKTAAVAGKVQDLGLSGGVPGTPINAFGFAQILRNTMGGNIRGTAKGTALSFSKRATDRYFDKHSEDLAELQEQGINVRTSYTEKGLQSFMKRVASAENKKGNSTIPAKTKQLFDESWDTAMNDPTFSRLLPVMQLDYYRHVRDNLKRVGVAPDKASKIAAKRLKEFEGLTDQATLAGRNKVANDALTTFLFAPKYRESMIKFWGNNIKALAPQNIVKALNPKSGEYRSNLIFNAAAVFLFMMMDKENQEQNEGRHLWDNPPGKKDKLLVKIGNGQTIGIPFLSSIATMPRTALNLGNDVISGNTEQLGKDAKSFLGYGIRPIADIVTNEDYFGNKIRRDGASFGENLKRSGMFALKQYNHPYIKAGISKVQSGNTKDPNDPNKKTDLQIVSEAAESPVRFYKDKSVKYGLMYEKFDKDLKGVSNQTKQQFERWHPGRNDMGELEPFDSNNFYSKERADALQDNDLYALEKKYAELQNKYHGKPLDPIFTLGEQERRLVLNKKALKPGQTDPELSKLYDKEWYQDYQNKSSQYYASKNEWNTAQGFESTFKNDNPYPEVPKELQNAMDFYSSLPKGTGARSGFIKSNPDVWSAMTNQWAMKDNWENKERAKYGLAATEGDAGVSNGFKEPTTKYASSSSKGGKGGKGGKGKKLGAIDFGTTDLVSTNKRLQALLGGTTVKAPKNKKVAVKKPKLKKVA